MNLTTKYLGLTLENPLVVGASPFCDNSAVARQLQDAGADVDFATTSTFVPRG